ncbi:MAG: flagellar motor protein MotB, partial [Proteobacteria bacterium]
MLQKLGNSYYFNNNFEKAAQWYGELFALTPDTEPEYYYRYAQTLKALKQYDKANQMMDAFNAKSANDGRAKLYSDAKDYLVQIEKNSGRYKIEDAGVNSSTSDYGSAVWNQQLIFTTARDTGNFAKRVNKWDNGYTTNFYSAPIATDGSLGTPKRWRTKVKTRFHEAIATFSPDGKTMYFSRSNFLDGKRGRNGDKKTLVKIYKSELKDSIWSAASDLSINNDDYHTGHPALSADGKWLYFSSNREGGQGGSDIWRTAVAADGSLGTPENLGPAINTPGRDAFPFISSAGELYFSTDGRPGLGGLDIYVSKPETDGSYKMAYNIGAPANSPA